MLAALITSLILGAANVSGAYRHRDFHDAITPDYIWQVAALLFAG